MLGTLVDEADLEALVEERHHLQALEHRLGAELGLLEHGGIGPERDRRAGASARRLAGDFELALRLAALRELEAVALLVAVDLEHEPARQRVHDRDAHAVEAARDLVAGAAELAAGMQHREDHLRRALALVRPRGVRIDRDAPPVVDDAAAAVGQQRDVDAGAVARHRLVDGVVDDLPDEVVKAARTRRPDVHAGALPDRFEALEHSDVAGVVRGHRLRQGRVPFSGWNAKEIPEKTAGQRPESRCRQCTRGVSRFRCSRACFAARSAALLTPVFALVAGRSRRARRAPRSKPPEARRRPPRAAR